MRTSRFSLLIALVGLAALVPAVFAGGWAVATLDEIPAGVTAGQPFTVSFTMRQHGVQPANWGTVPLTFTHTESRQTVVVTAEAEGGSGYYTVAVTLPEAGTWEWLLGEGLVQPMPSVRVQAPALAAPASAAPPAGPPLALLVALAGLVSLGLGLVAVLRTRRPWAAALTVGAALVAALGFAWPPAAPAASSGGEASAPADLGQALFLGKGCVMCHAHTAVSQVRRRTVGDFSSFSTGPDLSSFRASAEYLRLWLADPASVKPETQMPDLGLTAAEIEALIRFLNAGASAPASTAPAAACPVTPAVRAIPPDDPNADPFGDGPWLVNADRSLWAQWAGGWTASANGNKVIWIRPAGTSLQVAGRRLDGEAPPLRAEIPGGYGTGFQVSGLYFPASGCWSVTATAGDTQLEFVVAIP